MNKLVSVIIPVYNNEKTIASTLKSIINQTYKNLDIVLVNDGSSDNTKSICSGFCKQDKRIVLFNENNKGVSAARNIGIDIAHGELITFVDADDILHPKMIETLVSIIEKRGVDIAICKRKECDNSEVVFQTVQDENYSIVDNMRAIELSMVGMLPLYATGYVARKSLLESNRFSESIKVMEDAIFTLDVLKASDNVGISNEQLYYYIQTPFGITKNPKREYIDNIIANMSYVLKAFTPMINPSVINSYLCSNYTLAYNFNYRIGDDIYYRKTLENLFYLSEKNTKIKFLLHHKNWVSILLMKCKMYRIALKIKLLCKL